MIPGRRDDCAIPTLCPTVPSWQVPTHLWTGPTITRVRNSALIDSYQDCARAKFKRHFGTCLKTGLLVWRANGHRPLLSGPQSAGSALTPDALRFDTNLQSPRKPPSLGVSFRNPQLHSKPHPDFLCEAISISISPSLLLYSLMVHVTLSQERTLG
jgi:hypothetical protein